MPLKRGRPPKKGKRIKLRLEDDNYDFLPRDKTDETNRIVNQAIRDFRRNQHISGSRN
jgi:hypothetical protein